MKFKIFLAVMLFILAFSPVFSKDRPVVDHKTVATFNREFNGATDVRWTRSGEFKQARFTFLDHVFIAYFTEKGELVGTIRDILFNALPFPVMKSFQAQFPDAYYISVHEVLNEEGTMYWLKFEAGSKHYHVKSDALGNVLKTEVSKKKAF